MTHPDDEYPLVNAYSIIGEVSVEYANIEALLRDICFRLGEIESPHSKPNGDTPFAIALGWMELRALVPTARALAFRTISAPDYAKFDKLLKHIWDDLRISRNRMIHDQWVVTDDSEIFQSDEGARIVKPQAHQQKLIFRKYVEHEPKFNDLQKQRDLFIEARDQLRLLRSDLIKMQEG